MTSSTHEPPAPAWYRRLPKPPTEANPALHRASLLSQHHLFHDRPLGPGLEDDAPRRNTIHFPESSNSISSREEDAGRQRPSGNGDSETASPPKGGPSLDTADIQPGGDILPNTPYLREHFCLCPPDPKIPRPRNSFILFRQHQQASIIAQNPGIPNPEVSKIIGEQWRRLSAEAKEEWNLLAEEEKARHQQQYPGYRYHPRRNGRVSNQSSASGPSSAEPQEPCTKCGGRPMNYYGNPTPVYTPPVSHPQQAMGIQIPAKRACVVSGPPGQRMHGQPTVSSEHLPHQKSLVEPYPFQKVDHRLIYAVPPSQNLPTPPSSDSQDAKRRRFNSNGVDLPAREAYPDTTYSYAHSPTTAHTYTRPEVLQQIQASRMPVQRVQGVQAAKPAMVSPPRAGYPHPPQLQPVRPPRPHRRARSSVVLPPIETMVSQTPTKSSSTRSQSSGVEAMVMSIPVLNKTKLLSQISGPLPPPGLTSPKPEVRGAIIAIEGMDATTVNSMTHSLAEQLEKEGNFAVRIFSGPDPYCMIREARGGTNGHRGTVTTEAYLSMLGEWHKINKEMVEYITTRPGSKGGNGGSTSYASKSSPISIDISRNDPNHPMCGIDSPQALEKTVRIQSVLSDSLQSVTSPKTISSAAELSMVSPPGKATSQPTFEPSMTEPVSDIVTSSDDGGRPPPLTFPRPLNSTRIPPPPPTPRPATPPPPGTNLSSRVPSLRGSQSSSHALLPDTANQKSQDAQLSIRPNNAAIPVALVPHYQLTTVDASSISIPISDGFSPPAHWQWFATLWRGSTGPDITIVIKGLDEDHEEDEAAKTSMGPQVSTSIGRRDQSSNAGIGSTGTLSGVEIRLSDCRAVVVKTGIVSSSLSSILSPVGSSVAVGKAVKSSNSTPLYAADQAKEMENWEKAKRRVGFEVDEFLRR
ncbi:uncharacterized protein Z518_08063 [Rhinocladiella mackenziei CBS 650.93]|uniref:HMG box domain-containing protein n=1 Tax=Rhinocladiella mackenziei CBS 650.93 TaxID=1442369 RepID=A0A0D2I8D6_9EURO|nr:uncharacterized protein Z518_08063 [Rhinocladiella mackenziei CBS 650.93]KIX02124.1 hypothetical protein Z518_08063 [Rhinocladiella mackenziei CBS 650.93]